METKTWKGVLSEYVKKPDAVRKYYPDFERLLKDYWWDVLISYIFSRIEGIKHWSIYCGLVKLHQTEPSLTRALIDRDPMSRGRFKELFAIVYGSEIPAPILAKLSSSERVRDRFVHGKMSEPSGAESRRAVVDALEFTDEFSGLVESLSGIRILGDLRGFKGSKQSLSKDTTKWVLRGMGIASKG